MQSKLGICTRNLAFSLLLAANGLPAQAGFFDDILKKGAELVKSAEQTLGLQDAATTEFLAKTPEEQDAELEGLRIANKYDELFKKANALHAKGSFVGTYFVSGAYLQGWSVEKDHAKGFDLLKQAAASGNLRAQGVLGGLASMGNKAFPLEADLAKTYLLAGAKKYDEVAEILATLYETGSANIPKDLAKALDVYKSHPWGNAGKWSTKIATLEAELAPIPSAAEVLAQTPEQQDLLFQRLQKTEKYQPAFELASAMSDQGSAIGKFYLYLAYENGSGVTRDSAKAYAFLQASSDKGFSRALALHGMHLLGYKNTAEKNIPKGLQYLERSTAELSEPAALLARLYDEGSPEIPQDKPKALYWYRAIKDAKLAQESKPAIARLEEELKPFPTVAELMAMKPDQQQREFFKMDDKKKFTEMQALAQALHEQGSAVGTFFVGYLPMNGRLGAVDHKLGTQYWEQAADAGHALAQMRMGLGYRSGYWGLPKDEVKSIKYLQACYNDYNDCAYYLAYAHKNGSGGLSVNKTKALEIFRGYKWNPQYENNADIKKQIAALDPTAGSQEVFIKYMEALKSVGLKVTDVRTEGNSYHGDGTFLINREILLKFESELRVSTEEGVKPRLITSLESTRGSHNHALKPMAERIRIALENKFGNLRNVFHSDSTIIRQGW